MIVIKFKDFFENIDKNYQLPATISSSIKLNDKDKVDVKIGTNTNKFILALDNEDELVSLFCLNFNSMIPSFITPNQTNLPVNELASVTESIISSLDGVSTHLIKFPEASRAAGQAFVKKGKFSNAGLAVDSSTEFFGKEKIYAQNASTMKFARPFSSDFYFDNKVISFLEIFSNLNNYKIFEKFAQLLFGNFLSTLVDKAQQVLSGVIDVTHENTIINIPVNGKYISTSPIASAKLLNALQYSNYYPDNFRIKNLRISVGGSNPQNAADYLSNISGSQRLLISTPPKIRISTVAAKNFLFKFNHGFSQSLSYSVPFINESLKNKDHVTHINNVLSLAYKEELESFETTILEKSVFLDNLILYKLKDIYHVIDNYYFMFNKVNSEAIKYNESLIHLISRKTRLTKLPEDSDVNIKLNSFIDIYELNTPSDLKNIENGIIQDIKVSIESDFAKYNKTDYSSFDFGFEKCLLHKINKIVFGDDK